MTVELVGLLTEWRANVIAHTGYLVDPLLTDVARKKRPLKNLLVCMATLHLGSGGKGRCPEAMTDSSMNDLNPEL